MEVVRQLLVCLRQFLGIELYEIIVNCLASFGSVFFGFVLALFVEQRDKLKRKEESNNALIESLKKELEMIRDGIKRENEECKQNKGKDRPYFRYEFFVWETAKSSGQIMPISNEGYFQQLLKIYSLLYFADLREQRYFELYTKQLYAAKKKLTKEYLKNMNKKRMQDRENIVKEIDGFLEEKK